MSRKVSIESAGDAWADNLLHAAYDLAFRRRTLWGWLVALIFAAVPAWISILCWIDGNVLCGTVFASITLLIVSLRALCLARANATRDFQPR